MKEDLRDSVTRQVRAFYEACSFPGYEEFESPHDLVEKAKQGLYAMLLDDQLPLGIKVLDAGCGTGQLAIWLSLMNRKVVGIDISRASLRKGQEFKETFDLKDVHFLQMDLFRLGLKQEAFDYVFCNGVLLLAADPPEGFQALCDLLKRGGYIIVGMYNTYGRLLLDARRLLFRLTRGRLLWLDFFMRQPDVSDEKKRVWYLDQYENPYERQVSVGEILEWFRRNNVEYINSIPKVNLHEKLTEEERLFERHDPGTRLQHLIRQLQWIFTGSREGGFFITIGRKR